MKPDYIFPVLIVTHAICFYAGSLWGVRVYENAYKKQKEKNRKIIEAVKSSLK